MLDVRKKKSGVRCEYDLKKVCIFAGKMKLYGNGAGETREGRGGEEISPLSE